MPKFPDDRIWRVQILFPDWLKNNGVTDKVTASQAMSISNLN